MFSDALDHRRLLVIDDNRAMHEDFRKILNCSVPELDAVEALFQRQPRRHTVSLPKYSITSAYQGEDGVEAVRNSLRENAPFDVAFVDLRMPPGIDGIRTIEFLWKVDPELHVVVCTAYGGCEWVDIVERLGHTDQLLILKKPFDQAEVAQAANAMSIRRRHIAARSDGANLVDRMLDVVPCVLVAVDDQGAVTHWNAAAAAVTDIDSGVVIGLPIAELPIVWRPSGVFDDWDWNGEPVEPPTPLQIETRDGRLCDLMLRRHSLENKSFTTLQGTIPAATQKAAANARAFESFDAMELLQ